MTSVPATTLATADEVELRMVTEVDDRSFKQILSASRALHPSPSLPFIQCFTTFTQCVT
jgi:hypothetical protein